MTDPRDKPQATIIDGRGVERPVWNFPRTSTGVPPGCPLSAGEQAELERAIGVPWHARTPVPDPWFARLGRVAFLALVAAGLNFVEESAWDAWEVTFWACLVPMIAWRDLRAIRVTCAMFAGVGLTRSLWYGAGMHWGELAFGWIVTGLALVGALLPNSAWMRLSASRPDIKRWPGLVREQMVARNRCPSCAHPLTRLSEDRPMWLVCGHCAGLWLEPRRSGPAPARTPVACPQCGYELAGLPVSADLTIRCPECGSRVPLPAESTGAGLTDTCEPRCWKCKRSLRGLPLVLGDRVQCPECGQWRSGLTEADVRPSDATVP